MNKVNVSIIVNIMGFPSGSVVKNLPAMWEMQVQSLGWKDPLEEGLENPKDRGAWWSTVHRVAKSQTSLKQFSTHIAHIYVHILEKAMAPHSSTLAWRIPGTGEPGGRPSLGSHRVRHDWSDLAAAAAEEISVKNLPAIQEKLVCDPLEKEMATHSIIFAWWIPWTKEPGRLESMGLQRVGQD